eukprot:TRINITY_DN12711_c0_g1_i2.p1 TRINITY_DN12711_c0_g1~~TRINITY_DN12711_c0_g1_i2.p1  ORF type:complete len:341 (+),score=118.19 TRINITY_DN12711_c0_g1_i2:1401-2423(+)
MSLARKAPSSEGNHNADFCDALIELATWEKNVNRNHHKHNAYRKAAQALAGLDFRIKTGDEAKKLPGVGAKIALKIDEIIETGKLEKLDKIRKDDSSVAINLLTRVAGIGPAKAKDLYDAGIVTIEDLEKNVDKLSAAQKIGLKYFEEFEKRIPRHEIKEIEKKIRGVVESVDSEYIMTVCGSYRRGAVSSGDMDILLTHPSFVEGECGLGEKHKKDGRLLHRVVAALEEEGVITDTISHGETKFMGVCKRNEEAMARRLDIRLLPHDQYYCGVLYFTGSDMFNKGMRAWAIEQGFTLNEYNLRPTVGGLTPLEPLPVSSERDVFDYLDFKYKTPQQRSN